MATNISQLTKECFDWRHALHSYRDEFNKVNKQLPKVVQGPLTTEDLTELGHFQNQFYIQLINIHDLRKALKQHNQKVNHEVSHNGGHVSEKTVSDHAYLHDQYQMLEHTLQDIKHDYQNFVQSL
ncbi:hypothetical protein ACI6Q2_15670 [Chitinophagaceae bacterium LWZ2-11]